MGTTPQQTLTTQSNQGTTQATPQPQVTPEQIQMLLKALSAQQPTTVPQPQGQAPNISQEKPKQAKPCKNMPASVDSNGKATWWGKIRKRVYDKTGFDPNAEISGDCTPTKPQPGVQAIPQNPAQPVKR